ncbi:MAG TPA: hypothetical protein PLW14_09095 [Chlorobiota bacterium]|nr:hypothetical protein [Chlorobiota bacterium]
MTGRQPFSAIQHSIAKLVDRVEREATGERQRVIPPFPSEMLSKESTEKRRATVSQDFWAFDRTYFPPDIYPDGYSTACSMHKDIVRRMSTPGVHIIVGPRAHGKTVSALKGLVWRLVTGRIVVAGTYAETLLKSKNILESISILIKENDRLIHDFEVEVVKDNVDQFEFRTRDGRLRTVAAFSEDRSVKGFTKLFGRPEQVVADDIETLTSSMSRDSVITRIDKLSETLASLGRDGNVTVLANDFDERSAIHRLREDARLGLLADGWHIYEYRAWTGRGPLWRARYPARTEAELKALVMARSEADWQTNYQINPTSSEGEVFTRDYLRWGPVPQGCRGVIYVDPNLALKGRGDTTAIVRMMWHKKTGKFHVTFRCRSYASPQELLNDTLLMRTAGVRGIAMDGHVSQESHWTHHIRAWCQEHDEAYPAVEFKRYHVDELATNLQTIYQQGLIVFDEAMQGTEEGRDFIAQFVAFHSKKSKRKDDAPDAVICAYEFLLERRLVSRASSRDLTPVVIGDYY